jgi:hypothetical protein
MTLKTSLAAVLLFAVGIQLSYAQNYITIRGKVIDESTRQVIPYATIRLVGQPLEPPRMN